MTLETESEWSVKRRLILRDTLTFLSLTLITAVLVAVTQRHPHASHFQTGLSDE